MKALWKDILPNPDNPRVIKDYKFKKLVDSIKEFPEMLEKRPVVVDENNMILGGNMRYKAALEAGLKEISTIVADDWTEKQNKENLITDNVNYVDIICEESVDEKIVAALRQKIDIANEILGEELKEWL